MKKEKNYKVPTGRQPVYSAFKLFMRMIFRRPKIINLAGNIEKKSIILANHSNKSGPPCFDLFFPNKCVKWAAHEMFGNYKSRRTYLRDILYLKKCKASRARAVIMSTLFASVSQFVYKGMKMMPTYTDMRLSKTIKNSISCIDNDISVMVFPEDSNDGYKEVLTDFFPGFVLLADRYYKQKGEDLPIYPVYLHVKKRVMVIGKPIYMQELVAKGMDKFQIAKFYCDKVNELFFSYVKDYDRKGNKK